MNKKNLQNDKGITLIEIVVGIILLSIFTGLIINFIFESYSEAIGIQKSANAIAYATIILEKVDEKAYEEITNDFVNNLKSTSEIVIEDDYIIDFVVKPIEEFEEDLIKQVEVTIKYNSNNEQKFLTIKKLKIREIYKDEN